MAIPTIYTGKHQAQPKLGIGAVINPMAKAVLEETRRRQVKREKDEAEFLKMAEVENPFSSISGATNTKMEKDFNEFVEWESELWANNNGNLSTEQKLELGRKRTEYQNKIGRAQQIEMQVTKEMAEAMKNPDKWDLGVAKEAYDSYIKKGEYTSGLSPRSISTAEFYGKNPLQKDFFNITETAKKVGNKETKVKQVSLDKNDPAFIKRVQADLFSNQGLLKNAVNTFSSLPEKKQNEYFKLAQENGAQMQQDLNGDGTVDATDNAVFLSHLDSVYESLPLSKETKEDIQSTGTGSTFNFGQGKTKGNSFAYSDNVSGVFSEGTGKGLEFTSKSGFKVIGNKLKNDNGESVEGIPDTADVIPLRLKDGKLEVEVTYKPKTKETGYKGFIEDTPSKTTKTLYIDYDDISSKLLAEYPDIKKAIKQYGLGQKEAPKKKKEYDAVTGKWK
jgi:hypothetical protein